MTIKELIKMTDTDLKARIDCNNNFYIHLTKGGKFVDVCQGECGLLSVSGRGSSIQNALEDYCEKISNKKLRIGSLSVNGAEYYNLPKITIN